MQRKALLSGEAAIAGPFTPLLLALRVGAPTSELDTLLTTIDDPNALVPDHTVACDSYWQTVAEKSNYGVRFTNCSLLHIAVYHRHVYMVQALLRSGANFKPAHSETPEILFFCETPASPKWRYFGCTPLHLAVSGEEAVSVAGDSDAANVKERARQITTLLCDHIGALGNDAKRDIAEERCGDIEWFYRGGPFWQIQQATALQTAVFFSCNLETGRGADDAADLVRLLGADRSQVRCRHIIDDADDNADGFCRLFLLTADDFAAAFGLKDAWMDLPGREHDRVDAVTETLLNDVDSFSSCALHHERWRREGHPLFDKAESGGDY
jgi:hypothetical protein